MCCNLREKSSKALTNQNIMKDYEQAHNNPSSEMTSARDADDVNQP
jgi:hypothetical protein